MDFHRAIGIARQGFDAWAAKPHNASWLRKIDSTPIPNDLLVNIAEAFANADTAERQPSPPDTEKSSPPKPTGDSA